MGDSSDVRKVEKQRLNALMFDEAQAKYSEIVGSLAADKLRVAHQHQDREKGNTRAQYIESTMDCMEKAGVSNARSEKWIEARLNVLQDDRSKQVCRLKQKCTPTGAARKYLTTVTDVTILNYALGLEMARDGT